MAEPCFALPNNPAAHKWSVCEVMKGCCVLEMNPEGPEKPYDPAKALEAAYFAQPSSFLPAWKRNGNVVICLIIRNCMIHAHVLRNEGPSQKDP